MDERAALVDKLQRLWRAVKRDFFRNVEVVAGLGPEEEPAEPKTWKRLIRNWDELCALNIDVAAHLHYGLQEVCAELSRYGRPNSPGDHLLHELDEIIGVVKIGREANPTAQVETIGELHALGEEAIRREVDEDLRDSGSGA